METLKRGERERVRDYYHDNQNQMNKEGDRMTHLEKVETILSILIDKGINGKREEKHYL